MDTDNRNVGMDVMCDLTSELTEYIWDSILGNSTPHTVEQKNGDWRYVEGAQDIFNIVLDIVDEQLNGE